ncbi:MAG: dienelactone hydrolase family protein [Caulobacterales bacterium]|nr:dienelactone hydrolase family protein [Caulobacterales bacterium]
MSGSEITITGTAGSFTGYLARPGVDGTGPGVIVIQEIFGVNTWLRQVCDDLAREGFVALAPDLFWRQQPRVSLTDNTQAEWDRAMELMGGFDIDAGVDDIAASIDTLRRHEACAGKVGAIGFCLGGLLAYLTAARTDSDASVSYYGVNIPAFLAEADRISAPLMLHIAEKDSYVPPEAQDQIVQDLHNRAEVTIHRYPGMEHAFARNGGAHFDPAAAAEANDRTLAFFRSNLS